VVLWIATWDSQYHDGMMLSKSNNAMWGSSCVLVPADTLG